MRGLIAEESHMNVPRKHHPLSITRTYTCIEFHVKMHFYLLSDSCPSQVILREYKIDIHFMKTFRSHIKIIEIYTLKELFGLEQQNVWVLSSQ